jgi:dihydroxyacetone kinase phosphotransfer subunit
MVSLVIISHSAKIAEGVKEMADQMTGGAVPIVSCGGFEGGLGTDEERIRAGIQAVYSPDGVLILLDLGSAVLTAESVLETLSDSEREKIAIADAPLLEGALFSSVEASIGSPLSKVKEVAEQAAFFRKLETGNS